MRGEVSRRSYTIDREWDNRMQVVVLTDDGKTHVFNFDNYNCDDHSHIVYNRNGGKDYDGSYSKRECYNHPYPTRLVDYYNSIKVSSFDYPFEQIFDSSLETLDKEKLIELKKYISKFNNKKLVKTRKIETKLS